MRAIIVGTTYIESGWYRSMSCSVRSASNLPPSTTWLPASSAVTDHMNGPLWYSGPGISMRAVRRHHQQRRSRRDRSAPALVSRISFGRPVLPPDVIALPRIRHRVERGSPRVRRGVQPRQARRAGMVGGIDADDQRGCGQLDDPVELALRQSRRHRLRRRADLPRTRSSRRGTRREFGSAIMTMSPGPTPSAGERLARCRSRVVSSSARVTVAVLVGDRGMVGIGGGEVGERGGDTRSAGTARPFCLTLPLRRRRPSYASPPMSLEHLGTGHRRRLRAWARPPAGGSPPRARTCVVVDRDAGQGRGRRGRASAACSARPTSPTRRRCSAAVGGRGRARAAAHVHPLRGRRLGRTHDQPRTATRTTSTVPQDHRDQPDRHVQRAAARGVGHVGQRARRPTASGA